MSKYFNETQKTEDLFAQETLTARQNVATILRELRQATLPADPPSDASASQPSASADLTLTPPVAPLDGREVVLAADFPSILAGSQAGHYAMEAYRALRTRLMRLQAAKGLHSLVLSSTAPGEGKTVTCLNLGLCYAQLHGMPVLLIDADLRSRRLSHFLQNPPASGLAEVLSGQASYDDVIRKMEYANLHVLTAGQAVGSPPELFTGPGWSDLLAYCKSKFKIVLIDAPPVRPLADFELICASCDASLMVVRAQQTQREQLQQIAGQIDTKKLIGAVLNCAVSSSKISYYGQYGSTPS